MLAARHDDDDDDIYTYIHLCIYIYIYIYTVTVHKYLCQYVSLSYTHVTSGQSGT